MIRIVLPLSTAALALASAPALAQSVQDFQLPPNPSPTPTPTVQGPVDVEGGAPARPRAIPTATPTPTPEAQPTPLATPTPTPTPAQSRAPVEPRPAPTRQPPANRTAPAAPPSAQQAQTRPDSSTGVTSAPTEDTAAPLEQSRSPSPTTDVPEDTAAAENTSPVETTDPWWEWPLGLALLALLAFAGALWLRRRRQAAPAPRIEKPVPRHGGDVSGDVAPAAEPATLTLRPEAIRLSRSMMNATLSYRITVLNRGSAALTNVVIEADLGSASGDRPVEEQIASAAVAREPRHTIARLSAGQSARFEGQLQLPLREAGFIRQGRVALLVPLLRLRATADGLEPQARTFVIGQQGAGGSTRLQPFRVDDGMRSYEPLAQRALD